MSRMITRSQSGIDLKKAKIQPKPVTKNLKTSTKSKSKSADQKNTVTSQVKQANNVSMPLLKPRILIRSIDLESTKSFPVADQNIMKPAGVDARIDCQGTSRPVLKVLPMRRQTTEPTFKNKPVSSRRESLPTLSLPTRRSERIRLNQSIPIYFQPRESRYQKPAVHSIPVENPKINKNLPTSTMKISQRRRTSSVSKEHKERTDAQSKTTTKRKLAVEVHPIPVEKAKPDETLPLTSATKISQRRKSTFVSKELKERTDAQPKTATKRKLAVEVHPIPVENSKLDETLPLTSATKISQRRKTAFVSKEISLRRKTILVSKELEERTDAQQKTATKRKLAVAVHSIPVENSKVYENLPSTSATKISQRRKTTFVSKEHKEPTDPQPKTAANQVSGVSIAVHPSPVEILKVNENLPSTSATKISQRRKTTFVSKEHKEPTDPQPKTAANQESGVSIAVHPSPVEILKVNENLPSTSATKISQRRKTIFVSKELKERTDAQSKTATKRKLAVAVHSIPVENAKVNENLPSTSATKISQRRKTTFVSKEHKEPTDPQPKTAANQESGVSIAVHPSVEIPKVNENLPSTSATKISNQHKEPTDQPKTATKRKLEAFTSVHPSSVEIPKVNDNFASTSATKISKQTAMSTTVYSTPIPKKATEQMSAVPHHRQITTFISKEHRTPTTFSPPIHSTPIENPKTPANHMSANHQNPNEMLKLNENLPSTSGTKISKKLSTIVARKSADPSVLAEIPNGNSPSTSNVMANEGNIEIIVPRELKTLLVNDVEIVRQGKHYKIPATQSVAKIIELYVELKQTVRGDENHFGLTYKQIFDDVLDYFDLLLGEQLLYESERTRYLDIMNNFPGEKVSTLYPPIYLLRLFVKLNSLLQFSGTDKETLRYVVNYVNEFVKYLAENQSIFSDMNIFC